VPYLERDDAHIYYEDNEGDGPAVVLSHGILMDHEMFEPQVKVLDPEFRTIAWDERGHGNTTAEGSWTYWDSADDVVALLDHLDIERALLAGMSQGGFLSLRAALRAPDRVAGLFLIDTQAGPEDPAVAAMEKAMVEEWTTNGVNNDILDAVQSSIIGPGDYDEWRKKWSDRAPEDITGSFNALVEREDLTERLREIEAPALVLHGEMDMAIPMERAQALCSGLPNCERLVVVEGGTHASNLTHPEPVNEVLLDFARRTLS
jgi:3-oxoadipate enol-lactonase